MSNELTIGEVARDTGVPASTLRYWESTDCSRRLGVLAASAATTQRRFGEYR
jgi:DNA-binding transcriptional MerR regulator